jgi:hypothetical protein
MTTSRNRLPATALLAALGLAGCLAAVTTGCSLEPEATRQRTAAATGLTGETAAALRLTGALSVDGPAAVECGPVAAGEASGFRLRLRPEAASGVEIGVEVEVWLPAAAVEAGAGTAAAQVTVRRLVDGALVESGGDVEVDLHPADTAAGVHAATGRFDGLYRGEAGEGEVAAEIDRCYYFT